MEIILSYDNTFAIFNQTLIHPQMAQIIAEKAEEMASNLRNSAKSADKIPENILPKFWRRYCYDNHPAIV